ncbi:MAG: hypothetical protein V4691_04155 [Pseudomonadota bacterium]
MIYRTVAGIAALYAWGNPNLDGFRPQEIDAISTAVHQAFEPVVTEATNYAVKYIPPEVKYARINHPFILAERRLAKNNM